MININIKVEEPKEFPNYFVEGRVAKILIADKKIGYIGEIHPKILKNCKLKMPVALLEINIEEIYKKLA